MKYTLVTVVFEDELPLLQLQAASLRKFIAASMVETIVLIANSHDARFVRRRAKTAPFGVETAGRWSRIERRSLLPPDRLVETLAWQLLRRWGVVFRDVYIKERLVIP